MTETALQKRRLIFTLVPVVIFAGLAVSLFFGLGGDPRELRSVLIGKPAPEFTLPPIKGSNIPGLAASEFKSGGVTVVNIWASWCGPCRYEQPLLMELAKRTDIRLVGINNKDNAQNALRFLGDLGQPFAAIGADESGRTAIDWGGYGVPETFIIDGDGIIRFKWVGPLSPETLAGFLSEVEKAKQPLP